MLPLLLLPVLLLPVLLLLNKSSTKIFVVTLGVGSGVGCLCIGGLCVLPLMLLLLPLIVSS